MNYLFYHQYQKNRKQTNLNNIIDKKTDEKYKIVGKIKETEEVWSEFLSICSDNNIKIPKFPIWTDWWDSNGEGTSVTKYNNKLSKVENDKIIKKKQDAFYKKYTNWIDKNREFYKNNKKLLKPWIERSRNKKLWKGAVRKMEWQTTSDSLKINQVLWSPRGSGIRIKDLNYTPTLVAMTSMIPIYGPEGRYLTPRECARLQSFPEDYKIHENDNVAYKQFGNAVNVKMIEQCARFLINNEPLFN